MAVLIEKYPKRMYTAQLGLRTSTEGLTIEKTIGGWTYQMLDCEFTAQNIIVFQ